ncbi:Gfo/Idh/MocA family oxidoreductase [Leifsonia sp. F6_8S_P_1B]|uniref:Gfo/Idh/MocA family oxidoreductase n=1 Tax=Leifsonia williamsii TaxID=3035919 RepID=A0ABT8KHV0_9MICO|nr:Gfo/Idh/MocA family oxidoreductase [Leifsonia williamsii]MDN4616351.1 Gfo/Idh/MocA family oxidoreductase [Leifsonia williamsii]
MSAQRIRVGIIGAARVAPSALLRPAAEVDGVTVTSVASRDQARARSFARRHAIARALASYEDLLNDEEVDAVYIATPAAHHARWIMAAIAAGKHVLCEKPFTSNATSARAVEAAALDAPGLVVMEAYHSAYHPFQQRLRDVIASGDLGTVVSARATFAIPLISRKAIQWNPALGGGGLLDVGYYPLRQLRELFGEPERILESRAWAKDGVDRRFEATMLFPHGVQTQVVSAIWSHRVLASHLEVVGDRGRLQASWPYHPQSGTRMVVESGQSRRKEVADRRPTYAFQLEAFRDAIRSGVPPITGPAQAAAQLKAIDDLYGAAGLRPRASIN